MASSCSARRATSGACPRTAARPLRPRHLERANRHIGGRRSFPMAVTFCTCHKARRSMNSGSELSVLRKRNRSDASVPTHAMRPGTCCSSTTTGSWRSRSIPTRVDSPAILCRLRNRQPSSLRGCEASSLCPKQGDLHTARWATNLATAIAIGRPAGAVGEPGHYNNVNLSADDQQVVISRFTEPPGSLGTLIWMIDAARSGGASVD